MKKIKNFFKGLFNKFKNLPRRKKIILIVVIVILIIVLNSILSNFFKKPAYTTEAASLRDITEVITESGSIATGGRVDMYSVTNGVVDEIFVKNGDLVEANQDLFSVKSTATNQEKQAAYANYLAAKKLLEDGKATQYSLNSSMYDAWDSYKTLAENDTYENSDGTPKNDNRALPEYNIARNNWLASEANAKNQQIAVNQAQAQLSSTWLLYQATQNSVVKAPVEGMIANLSVVKGSGVKINSLSTSAQNPVLTIGNLSITEAAISLNENDVVKIKEGQEVEVDVDAVESKTYKGVVRRVDAIGTNLAGVVRYSAYIEVLDPDNLLRPGMSLDAQIVTERKDNVLTVPNSAVKPYKGGRAVRVPGKNGEIEFVPVRIGVRGESHAEILDGIDEGQIIITSLASENQKKTSPFGF